MKPVLGVAGWRAWYRGGQRFDSTSTSWEDLPELGVLVIKLWFTDGRSRYMSGSDWYFLQDSESGPIYGSLGFDSYRDKQWVLDRYPGARVLEGVWVSDAEMRSVLDEVDAAGAP